MQLAKAYSIIVNGGYDIKPSLVDKTSETKEKKDIIRAKKMGISDVDKKYANFIKLRQIIMKLAPQAIFLGIGSKILKITSAPPQTGGEHRGEQILKITSAPPPKWGGAQGGAFSMSRGSRGEHSPPSCGARHRTLPKGPLCSAGV